LQKIIYAVMTVQQVLCAEMHKFGRIVGHGGAKSTGAKGYVCPGTSKSTGANFPLPLWVRRLWGSLEHYRYDSVYLTCSKKLTGSQLSPPPHGTNKKLKCETENKIMSVVGPVQSHYHEGSAAQSFCRDAMQARPMPSCGRGLCVSVCVCVCLSRS